jgi:MoaA/NifB/PqqE/SkfB family radical SAM enzyme
MLLMFNSIYWEISGICNARCPYCCNGKNSISGEFHKKHSGLITPEKFIHALDYLFDKKQISPNLTTLNLYNWGEPLLHSDLNKILDYIAEVGYTYNISTNGSREYLFSPKAIKKFGNLTFSLPGFSQESYNRIHGFDFKSVLHNIKIL